jgi:hypothetical protein
MLEVRSHRHWWVTKTLVRVACLTTSTLGLLLVTAQARPAATAVVDYHPATPTGPPRSGSCWSSSIASNRPDAWRCMVGNEIFDPCFSARRGVVCAADPRRAGSGFLLRPTKPLPVPDAGSQPQPFMVELSDGSICDRFTGTLALVAGRIVRFGCPPARGCNGPDCPYRGLASLHPGRVWHARELTYRSGRDGPVLIGSVQVPLATVWH